MSQFIGHSYQILSLNWSQVIFYTTTTTFHHTHAIPVVGHHLAVDTNNLPPPSVSLPTRIIQFPRHNQNKTTTTTTPTKKTQQSVSPLPQHHTTTTTADPPPPPPKTTIIATTTSATTFTVTKSPPPPNSQTNTTISRTNPSTTTVATSMTITTTLPSPTNITTTITQKPTTSSHQYGKSLTADRKRERDNILTPKNPKSTPRVGTNHHLPSFAPVALSAVPKLAAGAVATEPQPTVSNIATAEKSRRHSQRWKNYHGTHIRGSKRRRRSHWRGGFTGCCGDRQ
ncbi:Hypothetical predicted protein [Olea europaea subsp. europaea]|uniref:Uncharacterized protein n=1 Tax=Olea europaea subsp. europaea TaxID=158383 RepID=A0A8S0S7J4_OLEEU|nr:Hypothetical predicted protein [Olea europaea subsp. europaea]